MKSARWKRLVLLLLLLILIYVWWDAFRTIHPAEVNFAINEPAVSSAAKSGPTVIPPYMEPKVNPFLHASAKTSNRGGQLRPSQPTDTIQRLGSRYRLIGVLDRARQSQAVIDGEGGSRVLSLGDSLEVWQLTTIRQNLVVFGRRKQTDTLWLYVEPKKLP